jgi:hypothetical protein
LPDRLEEYLSQQAADRRAAEQAPIIEAGLHAKAELRANFIRLDALIHNPDVLWFLDACVKPLVDAEQKAALDVSKDPSCRNDHAQRHHAGETILKLLASRHSETRNHIEAANAAQRSNHNIP